MSFFAVPLSGLTATQNSLKAISSNLANTNTDGYKDQNVTFNDVFSQAGTSNGALDPLQTGQGVNTASTTSDFTDGNTSATGINSNMALTGNGFFVVQQPGGAGIAYSRAGDFTTSKDGELIAPDGSLVLGYPAVNGVVNTAAPLQPLQVGTGSVAPASATTSFSANVNLNSSTAAGSTALPSTINVYDSLGAEHTLTISYTKSSTAANTWNYAITIPGADTGAANATTIKSGSLAFDTSGALTGSYAGQDGTGAADTPAGSISGLNTVALADGAAPLNVTWNLNDANGKSTISQSALASGTSNEVQNGSAAGALTGFSVLADGTVQASYTGGATRALGQVAVATVTNDQGLQQIGNNLFQVTAGSGTAQIGIAGSGGRGTITGGSVESSNVDTAAEFSKMIVAQQAYEANAKVVTTFNQVEQATIAMLQS